MNIRLETKAAFQLSYIVAYDNDTGKVVGQTACLPDTILARASFIEQANRLGWHIVSKDWDR